MSKQIQNQQAFLGTILGFICGRFLPMKELVPTVQTGVRNILVFQVSFNSEALRQAAVAFLHSRWTIEPIIGQVTAFPNEWMLPIGTPVPWTPPLEQIEALSHQAVEAAWEAQENPPELDPTMLEHLRAGRRVPAN